MTLRHRAIRAFEQAGGAWPADEGAALPLGGAAVQCETPHRAGLVCDVVQDTALMLRNAKLMVLLCSAAGWDEQAANTWIAQELIAAKKQARASVKIVGALTLALSVDHPPRLVVLKIEERV